MAQLPEVSSQFGRYHIIKKLGGGGMGAVYLAQVTGQERQVALKVAVNPRDPSTRERFLREPRLTERLTHPHLCPVEALGEHGGVPYFIMPFIKGKSLADCLIHRWQPAEAVDLMSKAASAVAALHQAGIIHQTLTPQRILLTENGDPVVMNLGLARDVNAPGKENLTRLAALQGNSSYMAPEQMLGQAALIAPCSDVYSLGVILYELLTGELPSFDSAGGPAGGSRALRPPSALGGSVDAPLDAICLRALAPNPKARYATAADLVHDLVEWQKSPAGMGAARRSQRTKPGDEQEVGVSVPRSGPTTLAKMNILIADLLATWRRLDPKVRVTAIGLAVTAFLVLTAVLTIAAESLWKRGRSSSNRDLGQKSSQWSSTGDGGLGSVGSSAGSGDGFVPSVGNDGGDSASATSSVPPPKSSTGGSSIVRESSSPPDPPGFKHFTLVPEGREGRVTEWDRDGQRRWRIGNLKQPIDAQVLPDDHVLIAELNGNRVAEHTLEGKVVWEKTISEPIACERLADGNTFIGTNHSVYVVGKDGAEVFQYSPGRSFFIHSTQHLSDGHIIMISRTGQVREVDADGKVVVSFSLPSGNNWSGIESAGDKRYLVANLSVVQEVNAEGKVLWEYQSAGACYASRLPNGNTLVALQSGNRIVEVDSDRKIVWQMIVISPWRVHQR